MDLVQGEERHGERLHGAQEPGEGQAEGLRVQGEAPGGSLPGPGEEDQ